MLQLISPKRKRDKPLKYPIYWKLIVKAPAFKPLVYRVDSLQELGHYTGVNQSTLQKIIYDKDYHSKKYSEALKIVEFQPVYE